MLCDTLSGSVLLVFSALWAACALGQRLREQDVLCNEHGCYVLYYQSKTFLESWRSCRQKNGSLATLTHPEEAAEVRKLFSGVQLYERHARVRVWIGLQRQPRQCSSTHPLRGFTWTTGDQDTKYTNWLQGDAPERCSSPRCVHMSYSTAPSESYRNFKWEDTTCSHPVDAFLCHYAYKGMCPLIQAEGGGPVRYSTPFDFLSTQITHVPLGSLATIPCPGSTVPDQTAFCILRNYEKVIWSKNSSFCSEELPDLCQRDNGGCQHTCRMAGTQYYCECDSGYILEDDGLTCSPGNDCQYVQCDFKCVPSSEGYLCTCMEGYLLASDNHSCVDEDECLQSPCPQLCVNTPGSFQCHCLEGYQFDETGDCVDVDECLDNLCEYACQNTAGSYICHCEPGFSPVPEDLSRCQDTDECQIPGTCQQMCVNYEGGFECHCEEGQALQLDNYSCKPIPETEELSSTTASYLPWDASLSQIPDFIWPQWPEKDWQTEPPALAWWTDQPKLPAPNPKELTEILQDEKTSRPNDDTPSWDESDSGDRTPYPLTSSPVGPSFPYWFQTEITDNPLTSFSNFITSPNAEKSDVPRGTKLHNGDNDRPETANSDWQTALPPASTLSLIFPTTHTEEFTKRNNTQHKDNTWLLVALLVPLLIIVLALVVLGIVYGTRCGIRPRNKTTSDCYYWISGSGDKVDPPKSQI
uniref:CD248 molecule, endosialin a n=1 Tax=Paramormyrops kingsleyae TaxID=1676925 RepID=A0A3B3T6X2_9TELE|nr:endosialin-like [Paramormyrops kingsleyae]